MRVKLPWKILCRFLPYSIFRSFRDELYDFAECFEYFQLLLLLVVVVVVVVVLLWEFFKTSASDGFSMKSEWQQVPLYLQDFSKYPSLF